MSSPVSEEPPPSDQSASGDGTQAEGSPQQPEQTPSEPSAGTPGAQESLVPPPDVEPGYGSVPAPQSSYPQQAYPPPGYAPPGYAPPGYAPPGYAQPGYPQGQYPGYPGYPSYPARPQSSSNAVIALVLAIAAWVVCPIVPAIVALVFAARADREIRASGGAITGLGLSTAAKIVAWINIGILAAMMLIAVAFFAIAVILGAMDANVQTTVSSLA